MPSHDVEVSKGSKLSPGCFLGARRGLGPLGLTTSGSAAAKIYELYPDVDRPAIGQATDLEDQLATNLRRYLRRVFDREPSRQRSPVLGAAGGGGDGAEVGIEAAAPSASRTCSY